MEMLEESDLATGWLWAPSALVWSLPSLSLACEPLGCRRAPSAKQGERLKVQPVKALGADRAWYMLLPEGVINGR